MYHLLCYENIWLLQPLKSYNMYLTHIKISSSPLQFINDVQHGMQITEQELIFGKEEVFWISIEPYDLTLGNKKSM